MQRGKRGRNYTDAKQIPILRLQLRFEFPNKSCWSNKCGVNVGFWTAITNLSGSYAFLNYIPGANYRIAERAEKLKTGDFELI